MKAFSLYLAILLTVHLAWFALYLCGTLMQTPRFGRRPSAAGDGSGSALVEIVVRTACGAAIVGFATFALGLAGLIQPLGFGLLLVLVVGAFALLGDPPWRAAFWTERFAVWKRAASPGAIVVWIVALPLCFLAAVPDLGSDATTVYMVYATEWARAHWLIADPFIRAPYYTYNWVLLDTLFVVLKQGAAVAGLSWLTGCLSMLGVYGFVLQSADRSETPVRPSAVLLSLAAVATLVTAPIFLRWSPSAAIDVPIGFVFFACAMSVVMLAHSRGKQGLPELVVCGAFFVGMKITFIAFTPIFAAFIVFGILVQRRPLRRALIPLAIFAVLASPWYVRSFVGTGDPVSPVLNLSLRGADPKWSKADLAIVEGDIKSHEGGPVARSAIPLDIVLHTSDWQFREVGVSFVYLALILPGAVCAYLLIRRRRPADLGPYAFAVLMLYAVALWIETSYLARYSLEFLAALAAFSGGLLGMISRRISALRWVAVAVVASLAIPSPGSAAFYTALRSVDEDFYANFVDSESWMAARGPARPEVDYITAALHRSKREDLRVYRVSIETDHLAWAERGITAVGDAIGPERYTDFYRAVYADGIPAYVKKFRIGVFVVPGVEGTAFTGALQARFAEEMAAMHWRRVVLTGRPFVMYFSPDLRS